jgi:Protein of unknown function (DUF2591)
MNTSALSDATLDCWVERAEILRLNPNASVAHPVHCQKFTLNPDIAAPIIKRERIVVEQFDDPYRGSQSVAYKLRDDEVEAPAGSRIWLGDTDLDAAMLCYIVSVFGEEVKFKLLWENGEPRYQPYE